MNHKHTKRLIEVFFLASLVTAGVVFAIVGKFFGTDIMSLHQDAIQEISHGWQYKAGTERKEIDQLPTRITGSAAMASEGLVLYYRLPEDLPRDPCLEFISQQTSVEVFIDGQCIYTYGASGDVLAGNLLGNSRNVVILPSDAGGKEVAIRLVPYHSPELYRVGTVTLGGRADILYRFVCSNIGLTVFCLFSVFFCLIVLFLAAFFRIKKLNIDNFSIASFALFIFLSTTWIITDSNILQLLTSNVALLYFISHLTFMLFPVPLFFFLHQTTSYGQKCYSALCGMYLIGFFVRVGLFFAGTVTLEASLTVTHAMMGIGAVAGCVLLAKEWRQSHDGTTLMFLVGFIALGFCLLISLLFFFWALEPSYSIYFRIMLMVMMVAMLYRIILRLGVLAKEGIEAQVYQKMAYVDVLTKLSNRLAFEEHMQSIQRAPSCHILTIVMLDINWLKHINDTYGHSAGDSLIQCAADCIRDKFAQAGKCYRIGGDEFAVILEDVSEPSFEMALRGFQSAVADAKPGNPEGLSIAVGYARGSAEGENFADRLLEKADQRMYIQKNELRQQKTSKV